MVRRIALEPAVVRVSIAAYDEVVRMLVGKRANRYALPDDVRSKITSTIDLALDGVRDPEALAKGALARLRSTPLVSRPIDQHAPDQS